eukprot:TRINITY_DN18147_c0_g1_i2.p2 TRINITY_DN18147_c0_g1~~TRINITY_DN18147_c0_g1_i2.p2  ORF type:complete len:416 (+),score=133.77 TRINITY_DN18147_c0_g1_i2:73-1320(+)
MMLAPARAAARGARHFSGTAVVAAGKRPPPAPYAARGVGRVRSELMVPAPKVRVELMEPDDQLDWREAQRSDDGKTAFEVASEVTGFPENVLMPLFKREMFMVTNRHGAVFPASAGYRLTNGDHLGIPKAMPEYLHRRLTNDTPAKKKLSLAEVKLIRSMIIHKNPDCFVINKPPGAPCEPSRGSGLSIYELLDGLKFNDADEPMIVNQLEQEVSGCMVIARNKEAHRYLKKELFNPRFPFFCFWGVIGKKPKGRRQRGRVQMHLEVNRSAAGDRVVVRVEPTPATQTAKLEYAVVSDSTEGPAWVSFYPITQRRHEMRIAASMVLKSPIIGDKKYGGNSTEVTRSLALFAGEHSNNMPLHMHCHMVVLPFEDNKGLRETIVAPLPKHMDILYKFLGWNRKMKDPYLLDEEGADF